MSNFYNERIVKKPRKNYTCDMCLKPITGRHIYLAAKSDDFITMRYHEKCAKIMNKICGECQFSFDCQMSMSKCFSEHMKEESK